MVDMNTPLSRKPRKTIDGRNGPFEVNRYDCGCVIASEFTNGSGIKTIEYCNMHKAAPKLLKALKEAASMVIDGDDDGAMMAAWKAVIAKAEGR